MNGRILGDWGEREAERWLKKHGARVLERNWRALGAEIDRIVKMDGRVVFVEVKTRSSEAFGTPSQAVTPVKRKHILRAAAAYLKEHGLSQAPVRFDVIEITSQGVRHLPGAFTLDDPMR